MNRLSKNEEKLKEMLNTNQFEYNPTHWQEAEKMLDAKSKESRSRFKAIWLTLPLLIIISGIIKWVSPIPSELVENKTQIEVPSTTDKQNIYNQPNNATQSNSSIVPVLPQTETERDLQNTIKHKVNINKTQKINTKTTDKITVKKLNSIKQNTINTDEGKTKEQLPNNLTQNDKPKLNNDKIITPENTIVLIPEENEKNKDKPINLKVKKSDITSTEKNDKEESLNQNNSITHTQPKAVDNDTSNEKKKAEQKQRDSKPPKQILIKNSISLLAGINYSRLIQPTGNNYGNTLYIGLQYQYQFSPKWQLNTGLAYSYVNARDLSKEYTKEEYSFGLTSNNIKISTSRLHYIELPILAKYNAYKNVSLVAGTNFTYLLSTSNTLANNTSTTLGNNIFEQTKTNKYRQGINPFDVQMQFGFEYKLNNNLQIGLLANTGLLDVSRNNYYNSTVFNRNNRLQLYIKYDFIRF